MSQKLTFFQASARIAGANFLTRLVGLARDITVAHLFGAMGVLDTFFIAFKIPNFLRRLFAEGAFAQGLVPMLAQSQYSKALFQSLLASVLILGSIVTLVAEIFAPFCIHIFAPGFVAHPEQFALTIYLFRILFPFLFCVLTAAVCSAALNTGYVFIWPALSPILLNITTLLAACFLNTYLAIPISSLAWGVLIGGILQVIFLLFVLYKQNWIIIPKLNTKMKELLGVMCNTLPGIVGVSIIQMGLFVDMILASYLPAGNISSLFYADRLAALPLALIGVAISSAILPYLSDNNVQQTPDSYEKTLKSGLQLMLLLGLPASIGLGILAIPITATVFQSGQFNAQNVVNTAACLRAFALSLPAMMIIKILASAINARQSFRIPCFIAFISLLINIGLGIGWVHFQKSTSLAYATAIAAWLNALALFFYTTKTHTFSSWLPGNLFIFRLLAGLFPMIAFLVYFLPKPVFWLNLPYQMRWIYLLFFITVSISLFFTIFFVIGMQSKRIK